MAYQVLARKYRPLRFSDVVGQDHVTRTLLNALAQNRIAHGYIFSGHRGIGKTTIARIVASALNCRTEIGTEKRPTPEPCNACESCLEIRDGSAVDVIEIDAATNRGIDEVRELRDAARYRPARDKFKIIILDEAHQITDAAFNALLKTLEEPPDHIVFMFATTEPENIPQTIRSRCQHFSFHAVKLEDIVGQLRKVSDHEGILVDDATLALLAEAGDGSMRDALSIMDQAIASAPVEGGQPHLALDQIRELMGTVSNVIYEQVLEAVKADNSADTLHIVARLLDAGNSPQSIARGFVRFLRNCIVARITGLSPESETVATGIAADLLQISNEERARAARSASLFTEEDLSRFLAIMLRTFDDLGFRQEQRFHLELGLLKLVHTQRLLPLEEVLSQIGAGSGSSAPKQVTTTSTERATAPATTPGPASATRATAAGTPPAPKPPTPPPGNNPFASQAAAAPTAIRETAPQAQAAPTPISANTGVEAGFRPPSTPTAAFQTTAASDALLGRGFNPAVPAAEKTGASAPEAIPPSPFAPKATPTQPMTEGALAIAADPEPSAPPKPHLVQTGGSLDDLAAAMAEALASAKGQETASHKIEESTFTLADDGSVQIQTTVSKAMLPLLFNADANKILTGVMAKLRPGTKFTLIPGTATAAAPVKKRAAAAGSIAAQAENHPMVQQAKSLFSAEISNIIDLREK